MVNDNKKILVTGANGQLGMEFRALENSHPRFQFIFAAKADLPIEDENAVDHFFKKYQPHFCVNCAAYTAVDKAETEYELAQAINAKAVGNLAAACAKYHSSFIHISTDYVYDGNGSKPYLESDTVSPVNAYGQSKLDGEILALQMNAESLIIRTSWVYSVYGKNFVKTMMRLMQEKESIQVVNDQLGCPTYAADLAEAIITIIQNGSFQKGIYHYCNQGVISWFEFASAIQQINKYDCKVNAIPTSAYPTPAKRPAYSALDTHKFSDTFSILIPEWKKSLERCLQKMP